MIWPDATAVVAHLQPQRAGWLVHADPQPTAVCLSMFQNVGQRFLGDAIRGHLDGGWQWWDMVRRFDLDLYARLSLVMRRAFTQGREQAELVQCRRPKVVDHAPDVCDCRLRARDKI